MEYWEFQKSQGKYKLNCYGNFKKVNGQLTFDMVNG